MAPVATALSLQVQGSLNERGSMKARRTRWVSPIKFTTLICIATTVLISVTSLGASAQTPDNGADASAKSESASAHNYHGVSRLKDGALAEAVESFQRAI